MGKSTVQEILDDQDEIVPVLVRAQISFNIILRDLRVLRGEKSSFTTVCWKSLTLNLLFSD
jgi:hypothetical protein